METVFMMDDGTVLTYEELGKYHNVKEEEYVMKQVIRRRRGRPVGFKMDQKSKDLIAKAKTGQKHKQETKDKISAGVLKAHETGAPIELIMSVDFSECGKFKDKRGYVRIDIPNPTVGESTYTQLYHVAIMERKIGRKLRRGEEVHHWSSKSDNRIEMITLCISRREHNVLDRAKKILDREPNTNIFETALEAI